MARALTDILTELNSTYNPQRDRSQQVYNKGVEALAPQEQADMSGLETAKNNAFESINTGANRRGMFFSGIPLAEQGKYVGENYLPSIAGLKNRYAGIRGNLYQTLAAQLGDIDNKQREFGQGLYNSEVQADIERERIAAAERAARASAASAGGGFSGSGAGNTQNGFTGVMGASTSLRQQWQQEANAGDWEAQTLLNFVGDDNNYDGQVNNQAEYDILKRYGVTGNYSVRPGSLRGVAGGIAAAGVAGAGGGAGGAGGGGW